MERHIRAFEEADRRPVLALLARAAEARPGEFAPPDEASWRWAFEANPAGRRVFVALEGERAVALVAGRPQRVWIDAREAEFVHVGLLAVDPELERGLAREGALLATARALLAAHGSRDAAMVWYGHPRPREWKLLREKLAAEVVRTETVLARPPGEAPERPAEVLDLERFDEQARWLYERCSGEWGASVLRHAEHLNWRFVDTPGRRYLRLGVRDGDGVLRGYAVARALDRDGRRVLAVADWLVPPAEPEVGELLFRGLLACCREGGCELVAAAIPDFSPWFDRFQRWGFRVHPSDHVLASRHFDKRFDQLWLHDGWWVQPGDTLRV